MTDYEIVSNYINQQIAYCEAHDCYNDCKIFEARGRCVLPNRITQDEYKMIMNYKSKPKSQEMLEELGFEFNPKTNNFQKGGKLCELIRVNSLVSLCPRMDIYIENAEKYLPAIKQLQKDIEEGLYDLL